VATKKNPEDVPAVPLPPAAPEASAPAVPVASEPAVPTEVPTPPPAPYGAPEAPAAPAAERPDPYSAPPAPSAPPASGYTAPPAAPYGAPAAPYGAPAAPYSAPAAPYGGQQPYSPGAYAAPGPAQGLSLAAMITGIAGAFLSLFAFGFLPALAAVILGHIASKRQPYAKPFWLTGIITGYVGVGISILWSLVWIVPLILVLVGAAAAGTAGY